MSPRDARAKRIWGSDDSATPRSPRRHGLFFAQVEMRDPLGRPIVVGTSGRGVVICHHKARALGVPRGMPTSRLVPHSLVHPQQPRPLPALLPPGHGDPRDNPRRHSNKSPSTKRRQLASSSAVVSALHRPPHHAPASARWPPAHPMSRRHQIRRQERLLTPEAPSSRTTVEDFGTPSRPGSARQGGASRPRGHRHHRRHNPTHRKLSSHPATTSATYPGASTAPYQPLAKISRHGTHLRRRALTSSSSSGCLRDSARRLLRPSRMDRRYQMRGADFHTIAQHRPLVAPTDTGRDIARAAQSLFAQACRRSAPVRRARRGIVPPDGVTVTRKTSASGRAMDQIRSKFGAVPGTHLLGSGSLAVRSAVTLQRWSGFSQCRGIGRQGGDARQWRSRDAPCEPV